jgi:3-phenylpropionate/trans-cinnamate dioxygenase ferredoxin reductase subunit
MSVHSVVVIGAGQAGFQVAASLRQAGFAGAVTLIGDENEVPYQRPPLTKAYLLGKIGVDALRFRKREFFVENRIELLLDPATAIDRTNQRVILKSGCAVAYDHLVLATGAHNRALPVPGIELDGVFGLRTLRDADSLAVRLKQANTLTVVGAGFIGLEFAAVAAARGMAVHVIELGSRVMARAVSPETSQLFGVAHSSWGVTIDFKQGLACIEGDQGRGTAIRTTDQRRLPTDLVVLGVGVLPNVTLATEAGLDIENGIRVDTDLLTSDPSITAIGDCASFPSRHSQDRVRLESVQNAVDQARCVAARLTGKSAPYAAVPWFWTDQQDLMLQIAGLQDGHDSTVVLGSAASRKMSVLCFHRNHLVAVESVNRPADHMAARKLLARAPTLTPAQASADDFDLKAFETATR